ncbi:MAG TPA: EVE domain-containing protein [Patescibacteria group bacterium]|nr:EVE domain-containing protein [Patescibacteria group bacterium]
MRYWLMKSEPESFSIDDLKRLKRDAWSGVRNYQARNFMKAMAVGDLAFFHHSSATPPGIAGLAVIVASAHPDATQFDRKSPYFDPKATKAKPIWECVDVGFKKKFKRLIPLDELRRMKALKDMVLLQRGSRLSVQPVSKKEFDAIMKVAGK